MKYEKNIVVEKKRELWMHKNTRIHLDKVKKLGTFLELETIVGKKNIIGARAEQHQAIQLLGLSSFSKVKGSYSDLIRR